MESIFTTCKSFVAPVVNKVNIQWNKFVVLMLWQATVIGQWITAHIPFGSFVVRYLSDSYQNDPFRVLLEALLALFVAGYILHRAAQPKRRHPHAILNLTEDQIEDCIAAWRPMPLIHTDTAKKASAHVDRVPVILSNVGTKVLVKQSPSNAAAQANSWKTNFASFNFLNFIGDPRIESAGLDAIKMYGIGTCGPRGFYGTLDAHLMLEKRIANFLEMDEAILYSYSFSTIASVVPTFAKRGDILVVDAGISFPIQRGVLVSRSTIKYFKHNDMQDLERILKEVAKESQKKKTPLTRRYIIAEGLYLNTGDICPLPDLIRLKNEYKYRLILDESVSFGVLGQHGRGVSEHYNLPANQIDILTGSLANSLGSTGGFCVGNTAVIDHQRLSASGYCFSASLPGVLATAALKGLDIMQSEPAMFVQLEQKARLLHKLLTKNTDILKTFEIVGVAPSPIVHLSLGNHKSKSSEDQLEILHKITNEALQKEDVMLTVARYVAEQEISEKRPSIRLAVSVGHSQSDIENLVRVIGVLARKYHDK